MVFTVEKFSAQTAITMSRIEAEEITAAILQNFDSLGLMLKSANERKAWMVLGYKNFGDYCTNEFGKSKSRAYQIIEEAEIAKSLREDGGSDFKIPAQSYLRLLKNLPTTDKQIEAIKYAEDLAGENNKPTKIQMQLAVEKVSGTKPEQFKQTLNELGFTKGAEVITVRGINIGSRGFIRKLDKKGQLWVEMHTGNSSLIPYDVTSLRVLSPSEKPQKKAWVGTTDIGDKVLIFSRGLENQIGEIAIRINEKMAGVRVNEKINELPYAELEVLEVVHEEPEQQPDGMSEKELIVLIKTQLIACGDKSALAKKIITNVWQMLLPEVKGEIENLNDVLKSYKKANDELHSINNELSESLLSCHREEAKLRARLEEAEQVIGQMVETTLDTVVDTTLDTIVDTTLDTTLDTILDTTLRTKIAQRREELNKEIAQQRGKLVGLTEKQAKKPKKEINHLTNSLLDLDTFEQIKVGQSVTKNSAPELIGTITDLFFSQGGMPQVMVHWLERDSTDSNAVCILDFNISEIQSEIEQW